MKKTLGLFLVVLNLYACHSKQKIKDTLLTVKTKTKEITVLYNEQLFPWEISADNLSFPYTKEGSNIGFLTDKDTVTLKLLPNDSIKINFIIRETDTIQAIAIGQSKPVDYPLEYINKYKGKYQVFAPEVHELVNICIALTEIGQKDSNMVFMNSDYYQDVMNHFSKFKNLEIIDKLNENITEVFGSETYNYYYNIRMNACMYSFDNNNKVVNNSPYHRLSFGTGNSLNELLPLLESFARKSDFKQFYESNIDYYNSLITRYHELVPVNKMWKWLEKKFPQKYDAYKIYFSPLIGGAHSTKSFLEGDFKETIMFVDAPIFIDHFTSKEKEAILARVIFTEIDHNYVNPTTDSFSELGNLLRPLECWNDGTQGYTNSYATFNEYMTYAIFTLYLYDNFEKGVFEKRNEVETTFMVDHRGFIKYKEFNKFVLEWYLNNPDKILSELYPEIIKWIEEEKC